MVNQRVKDKLDSWKRSFLTNWRLYKKSTIGLIGLGIIFFFILMAVLTPVIDWVDTEDKLIKDPIRWAAPNEDIVMMKYTEDDYWSLSPVPPRTSATSSADIGTFAYRHEHQKAEMGIRTLYIPTEEGVLYAINTGKPGETRWTVDLKDYYGYLGTNYSITTQPLAINLDPSAVPNVYSESVYVFFGNEKGDLFMVHDAWVNNAVYIDPTNMTFMGSIVRSVHLDGSPVLPHIYFDDNNTLKNFTDDLLYLGTQNGTFYALNMDRSDMSRLLSVEWSMKVDGPFVEGPSILTGGEDVTWVKKKLTAGNTKGTLFLFDIANKNLTTPLWEEDTGFPITTQIGISDANKRVYVVSQNDQKLGVIKAYNVSDGKLLNQTQPLSADKDGILFSPYVQQNTREIYVGVQQGSNESGYGIVYAIRSDFTVKWKYITRGPVITKPYFFLNDMNTYTGTTQGALYSLRTDASSAGGVAIFWQVKLPPEEDVTGSIVTTPVIITPVKPLNTQFLSPAIYPVVRIEDENGNVQTRVYAVSTLGTYLAPLPPTWSLRFKDTYDGVTYTAPPSGNFYILGTDHEGKDIFSQLMVGSRIALLIGFSAAFASITTGTLIGLISGYFGGNIDNVLMRIADVVLTMPFLPLVIILAAMLGPSVWNIVLAISAVGWPGIARTIRAETLSLKERAYIESAKITGASPWRIMLRHIAPNVMPLAFLFAMFSISGAILTEASLSFIGLGDPTSMSWGMMLYFITHTGKTLTAWWWLGPPGVSITLLSLGFFLVGRAFDEIVNPRLRER